MQELIMNRVCTVADEIIYQSNNVIQALIPSNSRLADHNSLLIMQLELIMTQVSSNLAQNTKKAFIYQNIGSFNGWSGSTVVLCCLQDKGKCKFFVSIQVQKNELH